MTTFNIKKVNTIILMVKNTKRAKTFYIDTLGLKEAEADGGMVWLKIGEGEQAIFLLLHPAEGSLEVKNDLTIELLVDDVAACTTAVKASDGRVIQEPVDRPWGVKEAVIEDPDGYRIWVVQSL